VDRQDLPNVQEWRFSPFPQLPSEGIPVEFRLIYDGWLPAASQRNPHAREKHDIRRDLSAQFAVLWANHPRLVRDAKEHARGHRETDIGTPNDPRGHMLVYHPERPTFSRAGRNFVPLVTNDLGVGCALDILFLRRDPPGGLVKVDGDIDNRIKTMFDALKMPTQDQEMFGAVEDEPNPFYCLLEDDRLITSVKVTTDRLLAPVGSEKEHIKDVRLIIHVQTVVLDPGNLTALSF
jgi:hypothetical protein